MIGSSTPSKSQLKAILIKFTADTNSHHLLQNILVTGIHNWINGLPFPMTQYPPDWHELIDSQSQIGWKQLLLGSFSVKWLEYQAQHLRINKIPFTNFNHGVVWLSTLIIKIWNHCYTLWESRNEDKHELPDVDPNWFHSTLEEHITKEPNLYQQQAWLETYKPMISQRIHDRDRVTQQRLHTNLMNIFHPFWLALPTSRGTPKLTKRSGNFLLSSFLRFFN
jgi:hypothetical protein